MTSPPIETPRGIESAATNSPPALHERFAQALGELKDAASALSQIATILAPLGNAPSFRDLSKLPTLIESLEKKLEAKFAGSPLADRGRALLEEARRELEEARRRLREELARDLREACAARGLELRVVSREEPVEIRIPPFAVRIDREKGRAEILFAKLPLETCAANAAEILEARERALRSLETGFDPGRFLESCRRAWLAARAASAVSAARPGSDERVEILEFLPYLALEMQRASFRADPIARNFQSYPRARFAWDVLRLRRAGLLGSDGWRLNLGVATGTTATQKKRVIWFEDEHGEGEFKLTVFFTRTGTEGTT